MKINQTISIAAKVKPDISEQLKAVAGLSNDRFCHKCANTGLQKEMKQVVKYCDCEEGPKKREEIETLPEGVEFKCVSQHGFYHYKVSLENGRVVEFAIEPTLYTAYAKCIKDMLKRQESNPVESIVSRPIKSADMFCKSIDESIQSICDVHKMEGKVKFTGNPDPDSNSGKESASKSEHGLRIDEASRRNSA